MPKRLKRFNLLEPKAGLKMALDSLKLSKVGGVAPHRRNIG